MARRRQRRDDWDDDDEPRPDYARRIYQLLVFVVAAVGLLVGMVVYGWVRL